MYYTVYKITNTLDNKIYIGIHKTKDLKDGYMGSGTYIQHAITKHGICNFKKEYLAVFDNFTDMIQMETLLVDEDFIKRNDTYNIVLGGGTTEGQVPVKDSKGNTYGVSITDPRYLSGELVPVATGTVPVRGADGVIIIVSTKDPRYVSGELKYMFADHVVVYDAAQNKNILISTKDPRYVSGEMCALGKGKIVVKDEHGNVFQTDVIDPRYVSGILTGVNKGRKIHTDEFKKKISVMNSVLQKGKGNSQYGTVWIYNIKEKLNKKVKKSECAQWLDKGWQKGRKIKF